MKSHKAAEIACLRTHGLDPRVQSHFFAGVRALLRPHSDHYTCDRITLLNARLG